PRWLRDLFQATEAYRHNERLLASSPTAPSVELWSDLARLAERLTGAAVVVLGEEPDGHVVLATAGATFPEGDRVAIRSSTTGDDPDGGAQAAAEVASRTGFPHVQPVPIVIDDRRVGIVCL